MSRFVLLGDTNVGKTCVLQKYIKNVFDSNESPTVGAAFANTKFNYHGEDQEVNIWDTAGQERFEAIAPIYSRGAIGALIVFDLTNRYSYSHIEKWMNLLEDRDSVYVVVCGNKVDLVQRNKNKDEKDKRVVDKKEAEAYCASIKALYFETSAVTGESINDAFNFLFMGAFDKVNQNLTTGSKDICEGNEKTKSVRKRQSSIDISKSEIDDDNNEGKKCC